MKTKQPSQCEKQKPFSLHWPSLPPLQSLTMLAKRQPLARAYRVARVSLNALINSLATNSRIYLAVVLMLVAAPLISVGYQLFPKTTHIPGWYYINYYYLFYTLSSHLYLLVTLTGIFFLFPQTTRRWFIIIPTGYTASKILWLLNNQFHTIVPVSFLMLGLLVATVWLFTWHWLMSRHYHQHDAYIARIKGLIDVPKLPSAMRKKLLHQELTKLQQLPAKY